MSRPDPDFNSRQIRINTQKKPKSPAPCATSAPEKTCPPPAQLNICTGKQPWSPARPAQHLHRQKTYCPRPGSPHSKQLTPISSAGQYDVTIRRGTQVLSPPKMVPLMSRPGPNFNSRQIRINTDKEPKCPAPCPTSAPEETCPPPPQDQHPKNLDPRARFTPQQEASPFGHLIVNKTLFVSTQKYCRSGIPVPF